MSVPESTEVVALERAHPFAQTNIQLLNQLREGGWNEAELRLASDAYALAMQLHAAAYRGDGKPFVMHGVGTASIAHALGRPAPSVAAGLLHAAYAQGDFGTGEVGITLEKRQRVGEAVGSEVESLVAAYTALEWNESAIRALSSRAGRLTGEELEVVYLRLANELEDLLDLGFAYSAKIDRDSAASTELARRLGLEWLARELERWSEANVELAPEVAGLARSESASFTLAPPSFVPRPRVVWRSRMRRVARRLRSSSRAVRRAA